MFEPGSIEWRNHTIWQRLRQALDTAARHQLSQSELDEYTTRLHAYVLAERDDARAQRGDAGHLTARWWRHVVARACYRVPGVRVENE